MRTWLVPVLLAAACGGTKSTAPAPASPAAEVVNAPPMPGETALPPITVVSERPGSVFASAVIPDPGATLAGAAAVMELAQPGSGAAIAPAMLGQLLGMAVGAPSLAGVDVTRPVYLVVLDPQSSRAPWLLAAAVSDQVALDESIAAVEGLRYQVHDGYAVIGRTDELMAAASYALTGLRGHEVPASPRATVYMDSVWATWGSQIQAGIAAASMAAASSDPAAAKAVSALMVSVTAALEQLDLLTVSLELGDAGASVTLGAVSKPDTTLTKLASAQRPATFGLLGAVARTGETLLAAGRIDPEPVADQYARWIASLADSDPASETIAAWTALMSGELVSGELAMSMFMPMMTNPGADKLRGTSVFEVRDAGKAIEAMRSAMSAQLLPYLSYRKDGKPYRYQGVPVDSWTMVIDGDKVPEAQKSTLTALYGEGLHTMFAPMGGHIVATMGAEAKPRMNAVIAAKAKPAKLPPGLQAAVDDAKARGESMLMLFDLTSVGVTGGFTMGVGFDDRTLALRLSLAADQIRAIASQM